jgi:dephospho-CoA kinase
MPYTIGLTGGIGSGKSSVAEILGALGATVIDADAIAHALTAAGGAAIAPIRATFGDDFIGADGALDRPRMRDLAFAEPAAKKRLEAILHPLIRAESDRKAAAATGPYVVLMIPLLVESGGAKPPGRDRYRRIAVVDCPPATQIARVMARSKLPEAQVQAIMAAQASREQRLAAADDVLDNSGTPGALRPQVERLHRRYLELAGLENA